MVQGGKNDAPASTDAREAQQQRILAAAMACFARSGFHKASMQDICAEAGMSAGNLYRYFRSKEAIIAAIAEAERVRNSALFELLERAEDPVLGLIELARRYLREMNGATRPCSAPKSSPKRCAIRKSGPCSNATSTRPTPPAPTRCAGVSSRATSIRHLDVDVAVRMLMALGDGIVAHRVIADFMTDDRTEAVLETMLERFLRPHAASPKAFIDPVSSQLAATPLPTSA